MGIDGYLESGDYSQAIMLFVENYPRVNAVVFVPLGESFLTVQVPLNEALAKHNNCRADFILKDVVGRKVQQHGFIQFSPQQITGYSYEGSIMLFQLENGTQVRFLGLDS